jgi:hypothetical protein
VSHRTDTPHSLRFRQNRRCSRSHLADHVKTEVARWTPVVKDAGVQMDYTDRTVIPLQVWQVNEGELRVCQSDDQGVRLWGYWFAEEKDVLLFRSAPLLSPRVPLALIRTGSHPPRASSGASAR